MPVMMNSLLLVLVLVLGLGVNYWKLAPVTVPSSFEVASDAVAQYGIL